MRLSGAPRFLTYEELRAEAGHYTYRPGWLLEVFPDPWEGPCLLITAKVADGYHTDRMIILRIRSLIPPMPTPQAFAVWLCWRLGQVELHETREYFQRDGRPVFDPHDPIEP